MPLVIQGIRLKSIEIVENDEGKNVIRGRYHLVGLEGKKVGSDESVTTEPNAYNTTQFVPSPQLQKQLADAAAAYRKELEMTIGLA